MSKARPAWRAGVIHAGYRALIVAQVILRMLLARARDSKDTAFCARDIEDACPFAVATERYLPAMYLRSPSPTKQCEVDLLRRVCGYAAEDDFDSTAPPTVLREAAGAI